MGGVQRYRGRGTKNDLLFGDDMGGHGHPNVDSWCNRPGHGPFFGYERQRCWEDGHWYASLGVETVVLPIRRLTGCEIDRSRKFLAAVGAGGGRGDESSPREVLD